MKAILIGRLTQFAPVRAVSTAAMAGICCMGLYWAGSTATVASDLPGKAVDLFQTTNIWNVHLQFTPEQWKEMEPAQSQDDFRVGGSPGGPRGPGGFGGGPGGPGGFGPGMFLAP